jgi:predicted glycosyltransferase/ActR/RegA family two-component response regulator
MTCGKSLLIVEDEGVLSGCLERFFTGRGLNVAVAGSIAEARSHLSQLNFDACLLDVGLPDGDGLSLIKDMDPARAIVITANPEEQRFADLGVQHLAPKPLDLDEIGELLDRLAPPPREARGASVVRLRPTADGALNGVDTLEAGDARPLRIMLYSHDTVGLGHLRRNLLLARSLARIEPTPSILMVSGATEAMHFAKPPGVDLLTLPGLTKVARRRYGSRNLGVSLSRIVALRSATIRAAAEGFSPDVVMIDNVPRGAESELVPTLEYLRRETSAHIVLGLRDVLDSPQVVSQEWGEAGNPETIRRLYDSVWVYGDPAVVDPRKEYGFDPELSSKVDFMGYLDRSLDIARDMDANPEDLRRPLQDARPYTLCLLGGGEDGARLAEAFLEVRACRDRRRVIILGPFMPDTARGAIHHAARFQEDLTVIDFLNEPTELIRRADAVISMGGHNSVSEILSFERRALIVPRTFPRKEQWIRAHRLADLGLVDVCEPENLSGARLAEWIENRSPRVRPNPQRVDMNGLDRVRERVLDIARERIPNYAEGEE